jgi:GDP-6-deoxy-D-talose 4-dehydrogenase
VASRSKKVLITGIDGFTGFYLEGLLEEAGYDVAGLVYPKSNKKSHLLCDIAKKEEVMSALSAIRPDYIIHLAGISFVPHSDIRQIYDVNLFGTLNILDALLEVEHAPAKVVLASSANVYGNSLEQTIDESVCPAPVNHYANSKLAMEFMARSYFDRLNILITRPFNYTGVGQGVQFLVPKIVAHFRAGKQEIELGNLDVVRDISDVRFVAAVYQRLMECDRASEIVNICSGKGVSLMDIVEKMNLSAGRRITVKINQDFVRKNEVKVLIGSDRKLSSLVGPLKKYPIEETLRWMFETA